MGITARLFALILTIRASVKVSSPFSSSLSMMAS
jgi:hypothetical protein